MGNDSPFFLKRFRSSHEPSIDTTTNVEPAALTELYCSENPEVDIVAVHGLNGKGFGTFRAKNAEHSWLDDPNMLPRDVKACRVLVYGYPAAVTAFLGSTCSDTILQLAQTLIAELAADRELNNAIERPIIFICHSLGGIVVKRALVYSASRTSHLTEHLHSIYVSTTGILFFGTPHLGSNTAHMGKRAQRAVDLLVPSKLLDTDSQLLLALESESDVLQDISDSFVPFIKRFQIAFFWEQKKSDLKVTWGYIVPEHSAAPILDGTERAGLAYDHRHMCKFASRNAAGYKLVAATIRRYARQAPATVATRWVEAKAQRPATGLTEALDDISEDSVESYNGPDPGLRQAVTLIHEQASVESSTDFADPSTDFNLDDNFSSLENEAARLPAIQHHHHECQQGDENSRVFVRSLESMQRPKSMRQEVGTHSSVKFYVSSCLIMILMIYLTRLFCWH